MALAQDNRLLNVQLPVDGETLLLGFAGTEGLSRLFNFHLTIAAENKAITPADVVGKPVAWGVMATDGEPRFFHGLVSRLSAGGRHTQYDLRTYRLQVVPWLWFLGRSADCRIFQEKATPEIIEALFGEFGFTDFELKLQDKYDPREYCVQYRETAFNFVSRLLEQEGIFYYFKHEADKHTLVLGDRRSAYCDCADANVRYSSGSLPGNHVSAWSHDYEFRSGKFAHTDYNFKTPSTDLLATASTLIEQPGADAFEVFDYPGEYEKRPEGATWIKVRMEEEEAAYNTVEGASSNRTFSPGGKFTLAEHEMAEENQEYVVTAIQHTATDVGYATDGTPGHYGNHFRCVPSTVLFRPARSTRKSVVQGVQTAVVVGPAGDEIFTDNFSRIKVQFHWDRRGKRDENSSCWIRVATIWAGKGFGIVNVPRIGQEVVIAFEEGDPYRPVIVGSVYNAEQMPPTNLPKEKMVGGLRSHSTPGGGGHNGLIFDDTKKKEKITLHAQYDMDSTIEHDDTQHVKNDRKITVDNTHTETIKNETKITISDGPYTHDVATGTATYHVRGALKEDYSTTQTTTVAKDIKITSSGTLVHITAATEIKLEVGASKILMKKDGSIEISGKNIGITGTEDVKIKGGAITSEADTDHNMKGNILVTEGVASNTVKGGMVMLNP